MGLEKVVGEAIEQFFWFLVEIFKEVVFVKGITIVLNYFEKFLFGKPNCFVCDGARGWVFHPTFLALQASVFLDYSCLI